MEKLECCVVNKEKMTYDDLLDIMNNNGMRYEGTHSMVNFVSAFYPKKFDAFYDILSRFLQDEDIGTDCEKSLDDMMTERYDFLKVEQEVAVSQNDIDTIMEKAIERGIRHWCRKVEVVGECLGESKSEQISRGGTLKLYDRKYERVYELTKDDLLKGIALWTENPIGTNNMELSYGRLKLTINGENDDSLMYDAILQYAVFGEIRRTLPNATCDREDEAYKYDDEDTTTCNSDGKFTTMNLRTEELMDILNLLKKSSMNMISVGIAGKLKIAMEIYSVENGYDLNITIELRDSNDSVLEAVNCNYDDNAELESALDYIRVCAMDNLTH